MKIAFVIPSLLNVGPNIFTKNLIEALLLYSKDVEIVVFHCRALDGLVFPVLTRPLSSLRRDEVETFDFFISTMLRADLWLAFGLHGINKERKLSFIHNMFDEDVDYLYKNSKLKKLLGKFAWVCAFRRIGRLIVSSPYMGERYMALIGGGVKIDLIPYGISDPRNRSAPYRWKPKSIGERFILISCGNLISRKNFGAVIRALPHLPGTHFRLIGDGPERSYLQGLAKELDVSDRVEFLGFRDDLAQQLAQAHCYIMSSFSEGYGLAMLEAIGLGMPVVCSDLPIYRGMLPPAAIPRFDPEDTAGLTAAISSVRDNQEEFAQRTRDIYMELHQASCMAKKFYEYIVGDRRE